MERTVRLALAHGVRIGAHPSYPDRQNFGRVELAMPDAELEENIHAQILRLEAVVKRCGAAIAHVKPHGALYNVAARDSSIAAVIARAVRRWNAGATIVGLAGSPCLNQWRAAGLSVAAEGFADRAYEPDGTLRSRSLPGALLTDPAAAARQAVALARRVDTICIHSDTPGAPAILAAVARALSAR
jgi:UPF0271 protein